MSLLFALAFGLVTTGIGWPLVIRLDRPRGLNDGEKALFAFLIGSLVEYFAIWGVGAARYDAVSMAALSVAAALLAIPGWRAFPWRHALRTLSWTREMATRDGWFACLLLICVSLLVNSLVGALAPPSDYDGLNYHLSLPKLDLERGFVGPEDVDPLGYMPAMGEMLFRLALALAGPEAAQLIHAMFGVATAAGSALLVRRWGASQTVALAAAAFFLGLHFVAWESGTTYVDLILSAYSIGALIAYMAWRQLPSVGQMSLFGAMIGAGINAKYHGLAVALAFAPLMAADLASRPKLVGHLILGPAIALASVCPLLIRNIAETGQPLPLLFDDSALWAARFMYGVGRSPLDFLFAPWDLSIYPSRFFDGQEVGAPYLLAFLPFAFRAQRSSRNPGPAIAVLFTYFAEWFWLLSQQVRFLSPVLPIVTALTAVGAAAAWEYVRPSALLRIPFVILACVLFVLQGLIVGGHSIMRWPVALGLMDTMTYLTKVPTIDGSHYSTCRFISERLGRGERFLFLAALRSYYCPQASMVKSWPSSGALELADYLERNRIRFVVSQTITEARDNADGRSYRTSVDGHLSGTSLGQALRRVKPVFRDPYADTFDANEIITALRDKALD